MRANLSMDIIIPSHRVDELVLKNIVCLTPPEGWTIYYYLVIDNPALIVPDYILKCYEQGKIHLFINEENKGPGETRNRGIRAGRSKWILLLDDDILPNPDLLLSYADAIRKNAEAIGFAGLTEFPEPFNAATLALKINGSITHFELPRYKREMTWTPTANVVLNREKIDPELFDPSLDKSGEDIEFLARNSFLFNEKYIAVPDAIVTHPWWGNGTIQTGRLFRYGQGGAEIVRKPVIAPYTYHDFTNTSETLLLLILTFPIAWAGGFEKIIGLLALAIILAEGLTNWLKAIQKGNTYSLAMGFYLMWIKNCYELGFLYESIKDGYFRGFAQRMELGFVKPNPGSFRLNRWKIIKSVVVLVLFCLMLIAKGKNK